MKKTINAAIGGCSFTIDEDAYKALEEYLERFKSCLDPNSAVNDTMDELEVRIADLLKGKLNGREVADLSMVQEIIAQVGFPQGYEQSSSGKKETAENVQAVRKLFRDPDDKKIAGVCSGLSLFIGVDVTMIRVIFLVALICGSAGFWIYLVMWIAAPEARTAVEKCEMRGIPANAENIRRFTQGQ